MKTSVEILKDIQLRENGFVFFRRSAHIRYDARSPRDRKLHTLLFQQGDGYGEAGDCCEYLTHGQLSDLERRGFVRIHGRAKR